MHVAYTIEETKAVVSYRAEECEITDEDHECTGDCTWLDGDKRELESPSTSEIEPDAYDLEEYDNSPVAWAVEYIWRKTDAVTPSVDPIGATVGAHCWISGSYNHPYLNDSHVTETSVRLTGDWTDEERAQVFRGIRDKLRS